MLRFIPRRIIDVSYNDKLKRCPNCFNLIRRRFPNKQRYCSECGQRLKYDDKK